LSHESVDTYYNRFQELLEDLSEAEVISTKIAIRHFIFTLGSDFETIQNNYRLGNLSPEWKTDDWPTILVLCCDYYNSINPQGPPKRDQPTDGAITAQVERNARHKKVRQWFLNPVKYCTEITAEQGRHPGKCIYHLSKSHPMEDCYVTKECDKLIADKKNSSSSSSALSSAGKLRQLTGETEDCGVEDSSEFLPEPTSNDTNEADLIYFARMTKQYLQLVNSTPSGVPQHKMKYPIIADSGTNFHLFKDLEFFETLSPANGHVILGDGTTKLAIQGIGTIKCKLGNNILSVDSVRYISELSESIYSLFLHIQHPNHSVYSTSEDGLFIVFPGFESKAILGESDIYLDATPYNLPPSDLGSGSSTLPSLITNNNIHCHHTTQQQIQETPDSVQLDNILKTLRQYYSEVKTKRQLNLNLPAGFCQDNTTQRNFKEFLPPATSSTGVALLPIILIHFSYCLLYQKILLSEIVLGHLLSVILELYLLIPAHLLSPTCLLLLLYRFYDA